MAALNANNPTLVDLAKRQDPDGTIAAVSEILNETSEILPDMTWREGNLVTGHMATIRTGIPQPTWRKIGQGVQPNKSTTGQITFGTAELAAYSEVDKVLADLNGNTNEFRLSEDRPKIEGMNQELALKLFYGNSATQPEAFTGLTPYYNSLSGAESSDNVINAGSTDTDNGSIWLVGWSPNTIYGIVPKGTQAGLSVVDKGQVTVEDASGGSNTGRYEAYRTFFQWFAGLVVEDWRFAVRICNIEKSALTKDAATGPDLPDLMYQALELIPNLGMVRPAFYMSRAMRSTVRRQATNLTKNSTLTIDNVGGTMLMNFQGVPLRRVDALAADEALVA